MRAVKIVCSRRWCWPAVAVVGAVVAVAGCAPPKPLLQPLSPASADHNETQRQQVTIDYRGHRQTFQVVFKLRPQRLTLIGLSPLGARVFTLTSRHGQIDLDTSIPAARRLQPARVLSDLQLAYWPARVLRQHLPSDVTLQQTATDRLLWRSHHLIWLALRDSPHRWHTGVTVYNVRLGYRIIIKPLGDSTDS